MAHVSCLTTVMFTVASLMVGVIHPSVAVATATASQATSPGDTNSVLRWSSSGGGWRSMFASVAYANLFAQSNVDILPNNISSISTVSGSAWFSAQLFYSQQFYDRVVKASPDELYAFVIEWMGSYYEMSVEAIANVNVSIEEGWAEALYNMTKVATTGEEEDSFLMQIIASLQYFDGDWANFVESMLVSASNSYGDSDFGAKLAGSDNRVNPLKDVDLLIQTSLAPNYRIRAASYAENDTIVYVGDSDAQLYTVPLTSAYIVEGPGTRYVYTSASLHDNSLQVQSGETSPYFALKDWDQFNLYPPKDGTILIDDDEVSISEGKSVFSTPFGGGDATVIQAASISSADGVFYSPLVPSTYAQVMSRVRDSIPGKEIEKLLLFNKATSFFYDNITLFDNLAVCSQWPNPCGIDDGMFMDGGWSDNSAVAINIAQYQKTGGDLCKKIKIIVTLMSSSWDEFNRNQILQYFESPINEGVEPGGLIWPSGMIYPYQSPQLFSEPMNSSTLDSLLEPFADSNMTTAILRGETINNAAFGIRAGQSVEILLINLNEAITTVIVTPELIEKWTETLASMTKNIAENKVLAARIKAFVEPVTAPNDVSSCARRLLSKAAIALIATAHYCLL